MPKNVPVWIPLVLLAAWMVSAAVMGGQTRVNPNQIAGTLEHLSVLQCAGVTSAPGVTPASDCTGLYYFDLLKADGVELKVVGTMPAPDFVLDPAHWSIVP